MNSIEKCPLCGKMPQMYPDDVAATMNYECCSAHVTGLECWNQYAAAMEWGTDRPKIVALTGSTKFKKDFQRIAAEETLKGNIVLTVHVFRHEPEWAHLSKDQTDALDALFEHKIRMCDELIVINTDGYIGNGTAVDVEKAKQMGKPVRYGCAEAHSPVEDNAFWRCWETTMDEALQHHDQAYGKAMASVLDVTEGHVGSGPPERHRLNRRERI